MTQITTGKESGLALEKCQEMMRHVAQWKKAGRHIHDQGYYQRGKLAKYRQYMGISLHDAYLAAKGRTKNKKIYKK